MQDTVRQMSQQTDTRITITWHSRDGHADRRQPSNSESDCQRSGRGSSVKVNLMPADKLQEIQNYKRPLDALL